MTQHKISQHGQWQDQNPAVEIEKNKETIKFTTASTQFDEILKKSLNNN